MSLFLAALWVLDPTSIVWIDPPRTPSPGVEHHTFQSAVLGREVGYRVYLPPSYETDARRRFPVVYWLHGRGGSESRDSFPSATVDKAIEAGDLPPFIVVYANGGQATQWTDWSDGTVRSETLFVRELIPHIDRSYRTLPHRSGRALQGMSMGASGAVRLAFKHPNLFGSVVAFAGGFTDWDTASARDPAAIEQIWGTRSNFERSRPTAHLTRNLPAIRGRLAIMLVVGTQDELATEGTRAMARRLERLQVPHELDEAPGIGHSLKDLAAHVGSRALAFSARHFAEPRQARAPALSARKR